METSKRDWKLYREKLPGWQESYMEKLVEKYIEYLKSDEKASTKFWELEKRIKRDKKNPGVLIEVSKQDLSFDLVRLILEGVITIHDLDDFSDELKDEVKSDVYKKFGFIQTGDEQTKGGFQYVPMVYKNLINKLQDKDDKKAYELFKEINAKSAISNDYYSCFDDFLDLINSKSSFVRTRGFTLCCAQARWDTQGKLQRALPEMLKLLHDEKPTVVRQCLAALHEVALYRPEHCEVISKELQTMDLSKYKDSMAPLIQKDIIELQRVVDVF